MLSLSSCVIAQYVSAYPRPSRRRLPRAVDAVEEGMGRELGARDGRIDWSRAVVDSCSVRAVYAGEQTGPNPTDRAKRGSKRHLICDGRGVPLAIRLTGANRNDSQEA